MLINNSKNIHANAGSDLVVEQRLAEAARYALLRRLAPSIRHNMAGSIQPVAMTAALMKRRLQKPEFDRITLEKTADDIGILARQATQAAVESMLWFAPQGDSAVGLVPGLGECFQVLQTPLSFQGFEINRQALDHNAQAGSMLVAKNKLRCVFSAALLTITDSAAAAGLAGNVVIEGVHQTDQRLLLAITLKDVHASPANDSVPAYRNLLAADAQAIAATEGVGLKWTHQTMPTAPAQPHALQALPALQVLQVLTGVKLDFECLSFSSSVA